MLQNTLDNYDAISTLVVTVALAAVLLMVFLLRKNRGPNDVPLWLASALAGILVGAAGIAAVASGLGYTVIKRDEITSAADAVVNIPPGRDAAEAMGGGGGGGGGMGGGGGGMGAGMMGGGGGRGPSPKRQLTTLVRKLELLTGDISLQLTPEQSAAVATQLDELKSQEKLTDEQALQLYDKLLALLDDAQRAKQESIGLPFRRGGGGGFGGPGGGGDADANPFTEDENKQALESLRGRLTAEK